MTNCNLEFKNGLTQKDKNEYHNLAGKIKNRMFYHRQRYLDYDIQLNVLNKKFKEC